uniref:Uncharacterized protein n=1 Tax=Rhizophora mucronata TaxID=61149 RepID=A0A2P2NB69_RHIMU
MGSNFPFHSLFQWLMLQPCMLDRGQWSYRKVWYPLLLRGLGFLPYFLPEAPPI